MTSGAADRPDGARLRITTPPGWWDLPLDRATRHRDIAALVDERLDPNNDAARPEIIDVLEAAATAASDAGGVFASQFGVVGAGIEFAASVVVAVRKVADAGGATLLEQVRTLGGEPTDEASDHGAVVDTVLAPAVGELVRRRAIRRVALSPETLVPYLCVQYFVPVPGGQELATVTCGSPTAGAADSLMALFDAIATSIELEQTDFDDTGYSAPRRPVEHPPLKHGR